LNGVSACDFGLITKDDALIASHTHGSAVAIGGTLTDATPTQSGVIAGSSWVHTMGWGAHRFGFAAGVTLGQGIPIDFAHFEYLATVVQPSTSGGSQGSNEVSEVHVRCTGGTYDFDEFCPDCPNGHNSPGGRNFLIVFNTAQRVRIRGSRSGRKWWGSILAPFAEVVVDDTTGFIDGQVVARSYREEGGGAGALQLHGHCFSAHHDSHSGAQNTLQCGGNFCGTGSLASPAVNTAGQCADIWYGSKCARKARKNKCFKRKVRSKCAATCATCTIG